MVFALSNSNARAIEEKVSNQYIKGYIDAFVSSEVGVKNSVIDVTDTAVFINIDMTRVTRADFFKEKLENALKTRGIKRQLVLAAPKDGENNKVKKDTKFSNVFLPPSSLFEPLIADPKWPRFTLAYQYHFKNGILRHAFAPNFGASFSLFRSINPDSQFNWDFGVQAGLFAIMDIGINPTALVNADYYVAFPFTYSNGNISTLIRGYHISTHLGDEFMLTEKGKQTKRINLSYEGIDLLISKNFGGLRLYGGGGYIVHKDPSYVKPWKLLVGSEYYAENTIFSGRLRPVLGIDFKSEQNSKWHPQLSCKVGVQFENPTRNSHKVLLMLEYFNGKSFHGQFYNDNIHYIGLGLHSFL